MDLSQEIAISFFARNGHTRAEDLEDGEDKKKKKISGLYPPILATFFGRYLSEINLSFQGASVNGSVCCEKSCHCVHHAAWLTCLSLTRKLMRQTSHVTSMGTSLAASLN